MSPDDFDSSESPDDGLPEGFSDADAKPAVFVTTRETVAIEVSRLDDPRAPESCALAAHIDGRLVARSAMPPEAIDRLLELRLFETPVPLGLFAYEEAPGLQCRLFALVPRGALQGDSHEDEPWKESVPSYEDSREADDDDQSGEDAAPFETILLGHIVRFEKDRRHPTDLAAEAVDVLQRIINGTGPLEDADKRAIDDLLGSL